MNAFDGKWRPVTVAIAAVSAAIAVALLHNVLRGTQTRALLETPAKDLEMPVVHMTPLAPSHDFASVQDQALFYPTRRFYLAPSPNLTPAPPPRPEYRLLGTVVIPAKPTVALLGGPSGATRRVKAGDDLDGWTVLAVESHRVVLRYQDQSAEIANGSQIVAGGITAQSTGLRKVPLAQTAQAQNPVATRTLGGSGSASGASVAPFSPASMTPRLYRPPPTYPLTPR